MTGNISPCCGAEISSSWHECKSILLYASHPRLVDSLESGGLKDEDLWCAAACSPLLERQQNELLLPTSVITANLLLPCYSWPAELLPKPHRLQWELKHLEYVYVGTEIQTTYFSGCILP